MSKHGQFNKRGNSVTRGAGRVHSKNGVTVDMTKLQAEIDLRVAKFLKKMEVQND